jgi:hypothetical protein
VEAQYFNKNGSPKSGAMLAPNSKPTKLNKIQWIQVRTDSYKRFYGGWEQAGLRLGSVGKDAEGGVPNEEYHAAIMALPDYARPENQLFSTTEPQTTLTDST